MKNCKLNIEKKFSLIFFIVCFFNSTAFCSGKGFILITAKANSAKLLKYNSTVKKDNPTTWEVTLANITVLEGKEEFSTKIQTVELFARSKFALLNYERIYISIKIVDDDFEVLYWRPVIQLACLPEEFINESYVDYYFPDKFDRGDYKCSFIRGHRKKDKKNRRDRHSID